MKKIFTFLLASFLITTFYTPNVINAAEDSGMQIEYEGEESTYIQDFEYNEDTNEFEEINPYNRQISSKTLSLKIKTKPTYSGSNVKSLNVTFEYTWNKMPKMRFSDELAVGWDSNFRMKDSSFKKKDKYNTLSTVGKIHSSESRPSDIGSYGVAWDADLPGYQTTAYISYGSGSFTLVPRKTTKKGSKITLYGKYAHKTGTGSISYNLGKVGISASGGSGYDKAAIQSTVTFK
ncbi:hypothetical protein MKC91_11025 [[Clostridium] innocuum]|jgi:hypothetical protein|nr:hypothetical protein [Erysipelotrichaceae bacterium]MCR0380915.1 hypothetical protein [[Clostridium] innocuum]MCR0411406.1 hypothetical protein [[Clostridium] innocuum]MCR0534966.1 hypothetical protein [[Clostridium] innocuum]MCR0538935.1 hypothetical protein [[Clostridium] innocuum]